MMRRTTVVALALGASLVWGGVAGAQSGPDVTAAIYGGLCSDLGEEVAALNAPRPENGPWVGVEGLGIVLESDTDDVMSGQALVDNPHSIVVSAGIDVVACGEIGGYVDDDDLRIGLLPVADSGYFGIATLDDLYDDDDEVEIDLYVFQPVM